MRISVINLTHGLLSDIEIIDAIRAINRQINEDFAPYWNLRGQLRLEGNSAAQPNVDDPEDMQGEGIIYLWDKSDVPNALGYHDANYRGIPYGFVFVDIATEIGENWTVTFSHEALELIGDRQANKLVKGPDPRPEFIGQDKVVYHWHEMCDAVQDETYEIDGVEVSNFVLPLYFTEGTEPGSRNDFLGTRYHLEDSPASKSLESFHVNPGGYVGFFDPETNSHETFMGPESFNDVAGRKAIDHADYRRRRKNKARMARRGNRYTHVSADSATQEIKLKQDMPYKLEINERELTIKSNTTDLEVRAGLPGLSQETRQNMGYFSHDIYSNANQVNDDLVETGFEEIATLEIKPVAMRDDGEAPQAEIEVMHEAGDAVIALVEVDGVIFWQQAEKTNKELSVFSVRIKAIEKDERSRRGFLFKAAKTLVRFIRHKIVDEVKEWLTDKLPEYLSEMIEKKAFGKKIPARLHQIKVLKNPVNKTIGEIGEINGKLPGDKRYLLLIHGIFSSTKGAFSEFLVNRWDDEMLIRINRQYDKIIAFDHWTVAKSTLENATDLLAMLPDDCQLDIVCHSRGAGVTRCLLEHPDLAPSLGQRNINVGKAVFIAGACQGSPLANPSKIGILVNVFSAISSVTGNYLPLKLATGLLKAVQYGVKKFPGIAAMSPASPIFKELNKPGHQPDCKYIYSRSNYEPSGKLKSMLDEIGLDRLVFSGQRNDGVVPFAGAGKFDEHITAKAIPGPEYGITETEHVFHTAFFEQPEVRQLLIEHLK